VDEMKGVSHATTLGKLGDHERKAIWTELINRVLQYDEYRQMLAKAYPDVDPKDYSFVHAANALAAFQIDAFTLTDAPFDMYLRGDDTALNEAQKRGALLFYGKANCVSCHTGYLMTDQVFHNRVVPQLGPGKGELPGGGADGTWDGGRSGVTGWYMDAYKFRTPPLRNVAKTGPWMHDGAFATLESAVRHQLDPVGSARMYDPTVHLEKRYQETFHPHQTEEIISYAKKSGEISVVKLTDSEVNDVIAFLESLTSPQVDKLPYVTPKKVPSGFPVED
jgi:cytochrome c peroxidase